ncbi:RING finger protein 224 [Portunus trituberculatus]|uniref:RING finger protein 224 n=1 Tax=Portunus trituberculatus TaxID=210409 RepID=A0A5B7IEJ1_PORTR|nr:RING finger protein 224 [Portunus trituberculatus]
MGNGSECSLLPAPDILHTHALFHSYTCQSLSVLLPWSTLPPREGFTCVFSCCCCCCRQSSHTDGPGSSSSSSSSKRLLWAVSSLPRCVECVPHAAASFLQDDNVEDCPVCLITFDDTLRRPRTLPCGHTHCTPCINELEEEQEVITCPTCRTSHALPETGQFPISYITEAFIKKMRGLASVPLKAGKELTALAPVTQPAPRPTAGLSRKTQSLLQDQEAKILAAIRSCQEEQRQLADYLTTLGGWGGRQQRLEDELQTLMDQSKGAREVISREESRVEGRKEKVRQREEALHAALETLLTPATRQEAYEVIENADQLLVEVEEEEEEEREAVIPDVHVVTTVARVSVSPHLVCLHLTHSSDHGYLPCLSLFVYWAHFKL